MKVTFQGNPMTLKGQTLSVSDKAPDFKLVDNDLNDVCLSDTKGKRVFVSVPSIDTPVCDLETKRFNEEASKLDNVKVYVISMDLPFAQSRWCGANSASNVQLLSDYKYRSFGENYGVYVEELGLLARAVFIVDDENKIRYAEYCHEITNHPDYEAVLAALK